jgi:hypothetical protein
MVAEGSESSEGFGDMPSFLLSSDFKIFAGF